MTRKTEIAAAFGRAAATYDDHASVQREVAYRLAERIAALSLPARPRVLEIGCGSGFLTQALRPKLDQARWVVSDIAPAMVAACQNAFPGADDMVFVAADGERPCFASDRFDLICSSLAFQWFEDLPGALNRLHGLLAPGGWLAFSTLTQGALGEWRRAYEALGLTPAIPDYPTIQALAALVVEGQPLWAEADELTAPPSDGRAFLAGLKGIGAATPAPGRRPLSARDLRRVLRQFDADGAVASYRLAYAKLRRAGRDPPP